MPAGQKYAYVHVHGCRHACFGKPCFQNQSFKFVVGALVGLAWLGVGATCLIYVVVLAPGPGSIYNTGAPGRIRSEPC